MAEPTTVLSDLAIRQLRALKGKATRQKSPFMIGGGVRRFSAKAAPAITLRRKDYEAQKNG